jgi:hypothetical protein
MAAVLTVYVGSCDAYRPSSQRSRKSAPTTRPQPKTDVRELLRANREDDAEYPMDGGHRARPGVRSVCEGVRSILLPDYTEDKDKVSSGVGRRKSKTSANPFFKRRKHANKTKTP